MFGTPLAYESEDPTVMLRPVIEKLLRESPSNPSASNVGSAENVPRGIVEWDRKLAALVIFYGGVSSHRELARKILENVQDDDKHGTKSGTPLEERLYECLHKTWWKYKPRSGYSLRFREIIIGQINAYIGAQSAVRMTPAIFVNGGYEEFCRVFPKEPWWQIFRIIESDAEQMEALPPPHGPAVEDDVAYLLRVSRSLKFDLGSAAVARGKVDQKFYYRTPEAVAKWEQVISAQRYPLYDHCRDALSAFTRAEVWRQFFFAEDGRAITMLGGGSASKDLVLIDGALAHLPTSERLQYTIADISPVMAHSAYQVVDANLRRDGIKDRVNLETAWCDFLHLQEITNSIRPMGKRVAWLIPGNTFGNMNEREFLKSIKRKGNDGDLLVIGTEIVDPSRLASSIRQSAHHYDIPEVRDFVSPALMAVWHELKTAKSIEDLEKLIKPVPRFGDDNEHSVVPGAVTIELCLTLEGQLPLALLTSTKYDPMKLVDFVERRGFKNEAIIDSNMSRQYKQFVFRFVPGLPSDSSD